MASKYPTEGLGDRVNQVSREAGGKGVAGLYRHPESGEEMVTLSDPLFGEAQSNAAVQLGFVRVGDAPEGYVKQLDITGAAAAQGGTDSLKGLSARMELLEGVQTRNKELEAEIEKLRSAAAAGASTDSAALAISAQGAKEAAADQVKERGQGDATDGIAADASDFVPRSEVATQSIEQDELLGDRTKLDNPDAALKAGEGEEEVDIKKLNREELNALATTEGVEDAANLETYKTKADLVAAVEAKRKSQESEKA